MASKAIGFLNFKFGADLKGFDRAMKKAQKNLKRFGKNVEKTGKTLTTNLTLPILALGAASVKAFDEQAKAETKLLTALKGRTDVQQRLIEQAKQLQEITLFGDEETIAAQSMLAMMGLEEEAIRNLIPLIQDFAAAKEMDLVTAADLVAKSMGSSTNALSRYGIEITGAVGSSERLNTAVTELTEKFGGQAEEIAKIGAGPLIQMKNQLGDLAEELGMRLMPYVNQFVGFMKELIKKFDELTNSQKDNIVKWSLIVATIGPALIIFGKLVVGVTGLIKVFAALRTAVLLTGTAFKALTAAMVRNPIGAVITLITSAAAAYFLLETNTKKASRAQKEFNGVAESTDDAVKRISKSINDMGKDSFQLQIQEVKDLIAKIKGFEIKPNEFTKGVGLSDKQEKQIQDLNMLLFRLKQKQAEAKKEADELNKSLNNLGGTVGDLGDETENTKKEYKALNLELAHTKKISEDLIPKKSIKSFEEISGWVTKLTLEQEIFNAGMGMFGDILTSSLDDALSSQEKFFDVFVKNIKRAVQSLLIQLAVMTAIQALMGGGAGAFSMLNIKTNLAGLLGVPAFADGGLVTGPTTALIGEGIGTTASNPEVVAPLDKLKQFMGGGSQNVVVEGVIKGNDIFLSNRNTGYNRQRSV